MPRTKFELLYPHDGSRKQIGCSERNSLLVRNQIKATGPSSYKFVGEITKTFRGFVSFAEWRKLQPARPCESLSDEQQRYLADLQVIWLLEGEREWQSEERAWAFEERLDAMGFQPKPAEVVA